MRIKTLYGLLLLLPLLSGSAISTPPIVSNLKAEYRHGQVFVHWQEDPANQSELSVYLSDKPITSIAPSLKPAAEHIEPHSAADYMEDLTKCPRNADTKGGWIIGGGTQLDPADGFFVHTVTPADPAELYIAVTSDGDPVAAGQNSLTTPVAVKVEEIAAIWQKTEPEPKAPAGLPLIVILHAKTGRPKDLNYIVFGNAQMAWREGLAFKFSVEVTPQAVVLQPYDRVWVTRKLTESWDSRDRQYPVTETMWYGTSDSIYDAEKKLTGTPHNYSENRILWAMDWVQRQFKTDPNRVYAFGTSMGTAALRMGCLYPDRFAAVDLLVPILDGSYRNGQEDLARRYEPTCGPMNLICNDGCSLADRINMTKWIGKTSSDLPFITIRAGRQDEAVYWRPCPEFIRTVQQQRHGLLAGWDNGNHSTAMRKKLPYEFPALSDYRWYLDRFAINKSYPAFTGFSRDSNPGNGDITDGDIVGGINIGLDWNGIVDTPYRYEICVRLTGQEKIFPATVNITPRRVQKFKLSTGSVVTASNYDGNNLVQQKKITVDTSGLMTFELFQITSLKGNRLVYESASLPR